MFIHPVYANCPLCIVTVGGGLLVAKKLGIDDLLVSIWISGLNTAIAFYLVTKIKNKVLKNPYLWSVIFYLSTFIYLSITHQIGIVSNKFMGVDKIYFGMTIGLLTTLLANILANKKKIFDYQKVVIPFTFLVLATVIFKFLL